MARHDQKGRRSKEPKFVMLTEAMLASVAYRTLSNNARALLIEIINLFDGSNNGALFLGVRDAARLIGLADVNAAGRALRELRRHGFIALSVPGHFSIKQRHASCWRLTFRPSDGAGPTNEWRSWRPGPKPDPENPDPDMQVSVPEWEAEWARIERLREINLRCRKAAQSVLESYTDAAKRPRFRCTTVEDSNTARVQNPDFSMKPSVEESNTQILCQGQGAERAPLQACADARALARLQLGGETGAQRKLARAARLHESKLSRFLNDTAGRRTLTVDELDRLNRALDGRAWADAA